MLHWVQLGPDARGGADARFSERAGPWVVDDDFQQFAVASEKCVGRMLSEALKFGALGDRRLQDGYNLCEIPKCRSDASVSKNR